MQRKKQDISDFLGPNYSNNQKHLRKPHGNDTSNEKTGDIKGGRMGKEQRNNLKIIKRL